MSWHNDFYMKPPPEPPNGTAWAVLFFLSALTLVIFVAVHAHH